MAKTPEHAARPGRGGRFGAVGAVLSAAVVTLALAGCSAGGADGAGSAPSTAAPPSAASQKTGGSLRDKISRGLVQAGRADKASLVRQPQVSQYTEVKAPVLDPWKVYRFDTVPDAAGSFHVAIGPRERVFYLTESPKQFTALTGAVAMRVASGDTAVDLARLYVETTRSMREYSTIVTSVDDLEVAGDLTAAQRKSLAAAERRLRPLLAEPTAVRSGQGYAVTLYVQRGAVVEKRTIAVSATGEITDRATPIVKDVPAPASV
ncbi:MAG: hypothetical protein GEV11_16845 [Streptosporangiales bacterium]|nr:hypothetical protein [Streptosporangiales bacterium]